MAEIFVGQVAMDKITKALYKVTWYDGKNVELYSDKLKSHERINKEWFLDLFKIC